MNPRTARTIALIGLSGVVIGFCQMAFLAIVALVRHLYDSMILFGSLAIMLGVTLWYTYQAVKQRWL